MTEWRTCPGFPDYEVSESGDVRRVRRAKTRAPGKLLKLNVNRQRYALVALCNEQGRRDITVHRLVALAFIGPPPTERHQVAHYDGNGKNNHYSNLRWATAKENCQDRKRHGRQPEGERHPDAVLTVANVLEIRATLKAGGGRFPYGTRVGFARRFGISEEAIRAASLGKSWKCAV